MNKKVRALSKLLWLSVFVVGIVLASWFSAKDAEAACSHSYRWVTVKEPTCKETGYRNYTCSKCGHTKNSVTLSTVPSHSWNINAATCTVAKKCKVCGTTAQNATGHSCSWVTMKEPTCKEVGYRNYICSKCGQTTNSVTLGTVPNHTWNINAATCTVAKKCTTCGTVAQNATEHSCSWVTMKEPTCKETGYRNYICSKCGQTTNSVTLGTVPSHTWDRGAATCTAAKKCTTCGTIAQKALGHSYSWVTMKEPTCTETGYANDTCSTCGHTKNSITLDKIVHAKNVDYSETSESYKNGGYYNKLKSVTLTGNMRKDLLAVAESQIGYVESDNETDFSGVNGGSKNYTEYNYYFAKYTSYTGSLTLREKTKQADPWCAMFVSWCARSADIPVEYIPNHPGAKALTEACQKVYSKADVVSGTYTPQPGDLVYFDFSHVGIVKEFEFTDNANTPKLVTIEGNTSSTEKGSQNNGGGVFLRDDRGNYWGDVVYFGSFANKESCSICDCK